MERFKILGFILSLFFMLIPKTESLWRPPMRPPHPLCASQIALVNYACALLPFDYPPVLPNPPPLPPSPPDDFGRQSLASSNDDSHNHHHGHKHRHKHKHSHENEIPSSPAEENCCRWVQQVDSQCVCELLSRMPVFLERPRHKYTIAVGEACEVTYACEGKFRL